eukprot:CAMPEP_0113640360 /NCGR_PEP_ID=MMETSP0017_2-20120614/21182_1 /TAXON_ID=2856 /ORGANISM="Cylindrotheca closterium" /LENGTH=744 /DNA_ID=CAMNT_0000551637 /DNA_START=163 /DNA_END=2397 /DNA_ORIENTATION=+ /assembly_acc=CAM_ASM_000147
MAAAATSLKEESIAELYSFLDTKEADFGLDERARKLVSFICQQDEEGYQVLSNVIVQANKKDENGYTTPDAIAAARSYRAMTILKQDLSSNTQSPYGGYADMMMNQHEPAMIITQPDQAGLLAKQLLVALANKEQPSYTVVHIREVLAMLMDRFPGNVLASAASGGKQGLQAHLAPLLHSPITLSILTNLVCYGCTGRRGMPSAEKSQAAMQQQMMMNASGSQKIAAGARKKFVRQMAEFQLFDRLAQSLKEEEASGEEVCDAILTILEVVGYPPEDPQQQQQHQTMGKIPPMAPQVGENLLFGPLTSTEWWKDLLECLDQESRMEKKESIARTLHSAFALATGNSSRIVKSHAPARDATELPTAQDEKEEEEEEHVINRLVEWELTDQMHAALLQQLPLLLRTLNLPRSDILNYHATTDHNNNLNEEQEEEEEKNNNESANNTTIRHPGRYRTVPMGSWRVQLLSLLKEVICYSNTTGNSTGNNKPSQSTLAMDALMEFPLAPELLKSKKQKKKSNKAEEEETKEEEAANAEDDTVYNPWPALCSLVFAYPYNDFYHNIFYQMLQTVVLQHHEPTLRVIFQKSKFLTRALRSLSESSALKGLILQVLNLLRLRSQSLAPNAFLHQYLASHDLWKNDSDRLIELTLYQQKPIKQVPSAVPALFTPSTMVTLADIELGTEFANKLGLSGISKWDGTLEVEEQASKGAGADANGAGNGNGQPGQQQDGQGGKNKKKKNNKKKKKKK